MSELLPTPALEHSRPGVALLARVADASYWAGRYLERAEMIARAVLVHGETHFDLPVGADVGWLPLIALCGVEPPSPGHRSFASPRLAMADRSDHGQPSPDEHGVVHFMLSDRDNPSSVISCLVAIRSNIRVARSVFPREAWEACQTMWDAAESGVGSVQGRAVRVQWLRQIVDGCSRLNGLLWSTMPDAQALNLLRCGQFVERGDLTTRLLSARAASLFPVDGGVYIDVHRTAVLRSLAAWQGSLRTTGTTTSVSMVRSLLDDSQTGRSVAATLVELAGATSRLPHADQVDLSLQEATLALSEQAACLHSAEDMRRAAVSVQQALALVHAAIERSYFSGSTIFNDHAAEMPRSGDRFTLPVPLRRTPGRGGERGPRSELGWSVDGPTRSPDRPGPAFRRYHVEHRTTFRYHSQAVHASNEAHLRPRDTPHQRCLHSQLSVEPEPLNLTEQFDTFGNVMTTFEVTGAFDILSVTAISDVELRAVEVPDQSPPWETVRLVVEQDRSQPVRLARRLRAGSRLVPVDSALASYAMASFEPNRPLVDAVSDLTRRIHHDFHYEPGSTSVTTAVLDVLRQRRGVCQDFAHVAVGCLRSIGLAARYVSGYIETVPSPQTTSPSSASVPASDASHAWFSVFVPGWGWLDFDPTNNQTVSLDHVTTAWGRDYGDISPLRGTVSGGGPHELQVAVAMVRIAAR